MPDILAAAFWVNKWHEGDLLTEAREEGSPVIEEIKVYDLLWGRQKVKNGSPERSLNMFEKVCIWMIKWIYFLFLGLSN